MLELVIMFILKTTIDMYASKKENNHMHVLLICQRPLTLFGEQAFW